MKLLLALNLAILVACVVCQPPINPSTNGAGGATVTVGPTTVGSSPMPPGSSSMPPPQPTTTEMPMSTTEPNGWQPGTILFMILWYFVLVLDYFKNIIEAIFGFL